MSPKKTETAKNNKVRKISFEEYRPKVVVRFEDYNEIHDEKSGIAWLEQLFCHQKDRLEEQFGDLRFVPKFSGEQIKKINKLTLEAASKDRLYRPGSFGSFFNIESSSRIDQLALVKELLCCDEVKSAYIDRAGPDPVVNPDDDTRFVSQGYLDPAPDGIDAEYAWDFVGGDGEGQRFIDLERGWTLDHEDINAHSGSLLHGTNRDGSRAHGTSVLGEICAVDNSLGCVGITPNIDSFDVVSYFGSSRTDAMLAAIDNLAFGEVLLLEAQVWLNGTRLLGPIESYDAEYEVIRLATSLGIIVVEAGGNGTNNGFAPALNMDTYSTLGGEQIFNPASADFRDSGAIIVTAATSASPHTRRNYGPFGQRIDCYAWSQNIDTLQSNSSGATNLYRTNFGGTSGASPIIVGAALAVQGIMEAQSGYRLGPLQMRALLSNPMFGTTPATTETAAIGVMPDLRAIIDNALGVSHDVYIRDNLGDVGEPHTGSISSSPDIIILKDPELDPQAAFGQGSGNENNNMLGFEVELGQDNYIYTRVLNQGGGDASDVTVTLFWSEVSTLVTPDMWNLIGSTTISSVPSGEVLTVSDAIVWDRDDLPPEGHYCIVGVIGTDSDPAPLPTDFIDWANFRRYIRDNNNVTWRNFNVVDMEEDDPDVMIDDLEYYALPFLSPGASDIARAMNLEILGKLPSGAKLILEAPAHYLDGIGRGAIHRVKAKSSVGYLPLTPSARNVLDEVVYPVKSKTRMRLLVHIPKQRRKHAYDVSIRQRFEGEEVGRVTFRLTSKVKTKNMRFELYRDKQKEFRWRLLVGKKEIIADSGEGYTSRDKCIKDLNLVRAATVATPIIFLDS